MGTSIRTPRPAWRARSSVGPHRSPSIRAVGHNTRFEREALITARLQHPSIVRVYDAGTLGDEPFYAMEFVRGKSLDRVVAAADDASRRASPPRSSTTADGPPAVHVPRAHAAGKTDHHDADAPAPRRRRRLHPATGDRRRPSVR